MLQFVLGQAGEPAGGNTQQIHSEHRAVTVRGQEDAAKAPSGAAHGLPAANEGKGQEKATLTELPGLCRLPLFQQQRQIAGTSKVLQVSRNILW